MTQLPSAFDPPVGAAQPLAHDLRRILAPNPSPMTFRGTNTYLLGTSGLAVVDPGPDMPAHLDAILSAIRPNQRITHILVTHAHRDHSALARPLAEATGAPVLAFGPPTAGRSAMAQALARSDDPGGGEGLDGDFMTCRHLSDGEVIEGDGWQVEALWTPGHMGNHMCFAWQGAVFSGDLVMGWASSLISPPDGDMAHYMASCRRLKTRAPDVLHPGHGAPVRDPAARISQILTHRAAREAAVIHALAAGPADAATLATRIYGDIPAPLMPAATRNVLAHLLELTRKKQAVCVGPLGKDSLFRTTRRPPVRPGPGGPDSKLR